MDKYCLRWNEFESNIRDSFRNMREEQRLFDVTLATDDGHHIKAHKMILSAGSNFFSDIFMNTDHSNMLIYLKGISSAELQNLVEFMYNGEANIAQEILKQFLEAAQELQVKGLQGELHGLIKDESTKEKSAYQDANFGEDETEHKSSADIVGDESILDPLEDLSDSFNTSGATLVTMDEVNPQSNTKNVFLPQMEQMIEKNEGLWKCKVCDKTARTKGDIRKHSERHIEGISHDCHICSKVYRTSHNLQGHISDIHSKLFTCDICGKSGMNRKSYNKHKLMNHKTVSVKH